MTFTIDNFKTKIIRPAEYIFTSKDIGFLITHTIPDMDNIHKILSTVTPDGLTFSLEIDTLDEISEKIITVEFHKKNNEKYSLLFKSQINPLLCAGKDNTILSYWSADQLLKRIEIDIFKQIAKLESYDEEVYPVKK